MKPRELEPLPAEIAALLAIERRAPGPPAARQARILSRLEAAVGIAAGFAGGAGGAGSAEAAIAGGSAKGAILGLSLSKILVATVTLAAAGVGADVALHRRVERRFPAAVERHATQETRPLVDGAGVATPPPAPGPRAASRPAALGPAGPRSSWGSAVTPEPRDIVAESALLEEARQALARGDARTALARVSQHARTFPRGLLVEERETLWVKALMRSGDRGGARLRAAVFHRRFPGSIQREAIDRALGLPTDSSAGGQ